MKRRRTKKRRPAKRRRSTGKRHVARKKKGRKHSARRRRRAKMRRKLGGGKPQQKAKSYFGVPTNIYSQPWWFYENYRTTPEQAKAKWMAEYKAGEQPVFSEYYERSLRGEKL